MASPSRVPIVVVDDDDDDDDTAASPATLRKPSRSRATPSTAPDFLEAFSPSPPVPKRRASVTPILLLDDDDDDIPPPPKRRPEPPGSVMCETPQSLAPFSLPGRRSRAASGETHDSDSALPRSFCFDYDAAASRIPVSAPRCSVDLDPDTAAAKTPGFTTPRSVGPSSAPAFSSTSRTKHDLSGASCPISLDSDDELDDFGYKEFTPQKEDTPSKDEKKQETKMQKEADKHQRTEQKKLAKQKADCGSGKDALRSIVAEIDPTVLEIGSIGGSLLTRFAEKNFTFQVTPNPMKGSILWKMVPQNDQHPVSEVPYILFVLQAQEFCDLIRTGAFFNHVLEVRGRYPTFTICYVINKLVKHMKTSEQHQYANPSSSNSWKRPPVEEVLCKLVTHYDRVHSKQCTDEAEVAEHVVGLTTSLANCKFRKQLTWLYVHGNGVMSSKGSMDKALFKNNTWLRFLIAIPKVKPSLAVAISKKYSTMRSLLNVYMDPSKTEREKERLLEDLMCEDSFGNETKKLGKAWSKRLYNILMAQDGTMGADEALKS